MLFLIEYNLTNLVDFDRLLQIELANNLSILRLLSKIEVVLNLHVDLSLVLEFNLVQLESVIILRISSQVKSRFLNILGDLRSYESYKLGFVYSVCQQVQVLVALDKFGVLEFGTDLFEPV